MSKLTCSTNCKKETMNDGKKIMDVKGESALIECPICYDNKMPDDMADSDSGCGHRVCWKCYGSAHKSGNTINKCPLCREEFTKVKSSGDFYSQIGQSFSTRFPNLTESLAEQFQGQQLAEGGTRLGHPLFLSRNVPSSPLIFSSPQATPVLPSISLSTSINFNDSIWVEAESDTDNELNYLDCNGILNERFWEKSEVERNTILEKIINDLPPPVLPIQSMDDDDDCDAELALGAIEILQREQAALIIQMFWHKIKDIQEAKELRMILQPLNRENIIHDLNLTPSEIDYINKLANVE